MFESLSWKELLPMFLALAGVLVAGYTVFRIFKRAIRRMADRMEQETPERTEEIENWAAQLTRFIRHFLEIVVGAAVIFIVMKGLGIRGLPRITWEQVTGWLLGPGLRILFVLAGAFALTRVLRMLIARLPLFEVPRKGTPAEMAEQGKRAKTISRLMQTVVTVLAMTIAGLMVLRELGVDITPILTGAGIVGLAVGFGAQNLVRDVISGFFLILENQIRVGDVAMINGKGGLVEAIKLRTVVLRSLDGTVHIFPNGNIAELSNMTKDFSYCVLDLGVAYKENVDRVMEVLKQVGEELQKDAAYQRSIIRPLEIMGVEALADSSVVIRVRIMTVPLQQWVVGRELRRRIKNAFDENGIEIPYPHLSIYFGEASKPFAVQVAEKLGKPETPGG